MHKMERVENLTVCRLPNVVSPDEDVIVRQTHGGILNRPEIAHPQSYFAYWGSLTIDLGQCSSLCGIVGRPPNSFHLLL